MASRSDSGNETRGSSESDNSPTQTPTPTRELLHHHAHRDLHPYAREKQHPYQPQEVSQVALQPPPTSSSTSGPPSVRHSSGAHRITPTVRSTPIITSSVRSTATPTGSSSTRTTTTPTATPSQRSTPIARPALPSRLTPSSSSSTRLTPTAHHGQRPPLRPLPRRPPSSGMGSAGSVHAGAPLGPLASARGRQRNSVAVVDSREHIYEDLDLCRGPPKLAPVSGVLPQVSLAKFEATRNVSNEDVFQPISVLPAKSKGARAAHPWDTLGVARGPMGVVPALGDLPEGVSGFWRALGKDSEVLLVLRGCSSYSGHVCTSVLMTNSSVLLQGGLMAASSLSVFLFICRSLCCCAVSCLLCVFEVERAL
ncbi:putative uncharacterized protein ENSP00000383309 [Penaeus vannamei]|uniref:putative uncharacterized protein ENSP00000383309 n=1 Tax=Penaeus vannamei TaxID=6689 RepID=UPI00387F82FC